MKIERFEAVDRCLFWKEKKSLIVGDLHLGYEEFLNEQGWSFPRTQMEETLKIFSRIFEEIGKVKKIILLGDVKHYFAGILNKEFGDFYKLVEMFKRNLLKNGKIIIVKGNHDGILEPIVNQDRFKELIFLEECFIVDDVLFFHGHGWGKIKIDKKIKMIVTGHFHPAIKINDGEKVEKFKCFLFGNYKKKKWVVVPSFFPLEEGSDIFSGLERYSIGDFEVFVVSDKVYDFGKVKDIC